MWARWQILWQPVLPSRSRKRKNVAGSAEPLRTDNAQRPSPACQQGTVFFLSFTVLLDGFSSMILSVARKKSAGILSLLTQSTAKSAEKTCEKDTEQALSRHSPCTSCMRPPDRPSSPASWQSVRLHTCPALPARAVQCGRSNRNQDRHPPARWSCT